MLWYSADQQYVWHPYTQMQTAPPPIPIERGEGAWLYTPDGRAILDAVSSWWVNLHGHAHPHMAAAIGRQAARLEQVIFAGFAHEPAARLAEQLIGVLPANQARVFYSDNGSTAVEVGLKMAIQYHYNRGEPRRRILAFDNAFHGETFGGMSVGGDLSLFGAFAPYLFTVDRLPEPYAGQEDTALAALERELERGDVAAFIFEPLVQGAAGMRMYEAAALDRLVERCRAAGVLCIADEVMTGFGRTGRLFASDYLQHPPDILCLAKGLTGGYLPLSATTCSAEIYEAFLSEDKLKTFFHGHSYTANPIGCAAGLASLELLLDPACEANRQRIATQHRQFAERIAAHPAVRNVRYRGTILALEVETEGATSYFSNIRDYLYEFFLERNVLLRPLGNVVYILPPYCMRATELERVYGVIEEALETI